MKRLGTGLAALALFAAGFLAGTVIRDAGKVEVEGLQLKCGAGLEPLGLTGLCTHGTDPAEPMCIIPLNRCAPLLKYQPPAPPPCIGDGVSGKRIHLFYTYTATNNVEREAPYIRGSAGEADRYLMAAGNYHYRFLCNNGVVVVTPLKVAAQHLSDFVVAARAAGYKSTGRIYAAMGDGGGGGTATMDSDDTPGLTNKNNIGPAYSWTGQTGSWQVLMHEMGHNLGAVQNSAPHGSGRHHCWDEADIMCYDDGGSQIPNGEVQDICPTNQNQWDCRDDDYWNAGVVPVTSYLFNHWNLVHSEFLQKG